MGKVVGSFIYLRQNLAIHISQADFKLTVLLPLRPPWVIVSPLTGHFSYKKATHSPHCPKLWSLG